MNYELIVKNYEFSLIPNSYFLIPATERSIYG